MARRRDQLEYFLFRPPPLSSIYRRAEKGTSDHDIFEKGKKPAFFADFLILLHKDGLLRRTP
jgi:hypothetical protein